MSITMLSFSELYVTVFDTMCSQMDELYHM